MTVQIPGVQSVSPVALLEFKAWLTYIERTLPGLTRNYWSVAEHAKRVLKKYGFPKFSKFWHYGRQMIPLQSRLFMEQVFSDMGGAWASLITGFGPVTKYTPSPKVLLREREARSKQKSKRKPTKKKPSFSGFRNQSP